MAREHRLSDIINKVLDTRVLTQLNITSPHAFSRDLSQGSLLHEVDVANNNSSAPGGMQNIYKISSAEQAHAKKLLDNLALLANPICKKRGWRVGMLQEFYPSNPGLLGMNVSGGTSILVRLKSPHDHKSFLPWYDLVGTLVHELTHNDIGPHNEAFYALMDKVYGEVEALPNYNAICNEIRRGDGIGYLRGTGKYGVAPPTTSAYSGSTGSEGRKLGNHSGAFPFPQTTLIAPNGEVLRQGNVNNAIAGVDTSKLSLKEKMAMAALARQGTPNIPRKLGSGEAVSSDVNYRNLDKDEMRKLVLKNLEERRNRERSNASSGNAGNGAGTGTNDSCLCNNQQSRQIRSTSRLPQSDVCIPVVPSSKTTASASNSSSSSSSSSNKSNSAASVSKSRPTIESTPTRSTPLYFPYSDKLPPKPNPNSSLQTSSSLDDNPWMCQICLDFNSPGQQLCIFCGYDSGSVVSFNDDNNYDDVGYDDYDFDSGMSHDVSFHTGGGGKGGTTDMDALFNTSNSSSTSATLNHAVSNNSSSSASSSSSSSSRNTQVKVEKWDCLVCFENNSSNMNTDVHLCTFCGALRGYTLENEQEKLFLQSI